MFTLSLWPQLSPCISLHRFASVCPGLFGWGRVWVVRAEGVGEASDSDCKTLVNKGVQDGGKDWQTYLLLLPVVSESESPSLL